MNNKSPPGKSNSKQYQFLFKFPAKNPEKTLFCGHFRTKEIFPRIQLQWSPSIKMSEIQSTVEYYSITTSMQKSFSQFAQFIKSFVRYTWFRSPMLYKPLPIFDHAHPIIFKVTFSFPKFVSAHKKSARFIDSFLRYSRF